MKIKWIINLFTVILISQISSFAQTAELSELLKDTQIISEKTVNQAYFEFSYDFKRIIEKKGDKKRSETFESVCSKKRCVYISVENDGKRLSEKEIIKNREKAAARLEKAEKNPEPDFVLTRNFIPPYDFLMRNVVRKNPYFNSNFYLKNCKINFLENVVIENRPTTKVSASNCDYNYQISRIAALKLPADFIYPKSEALIWIDKRDKAVVKIEIYADDELNKDSGALKPTAILETARVPEGFWFWKHITINSDNKKFFHDNQRDWEIYFYNYKPFMVTVDKAEISKK